MQILWISGEVKLFFLNGKLLMNAIILHIVRWRHNYKYIRMSPCGALAIFFLLFVVRKTPHLFSMAVLTTQSKGSTSFKSEVWLRITMLEPTFRYVHNSVLQYSTVASQVKVIFTNSGRECPMNFVVCADIDGGKILCHPLAYPSHVWQIKSSMVSSQVVNIKKKLTECKPLWTPSHGRTRTH